MQSVITVRSIPMGAGGVVTFFLVIEIQQGYNEHE